MKSVFPRPNAALCALSLTVLCLPAMAEDDTATQQANEDDLQAIVVTASRATRSSVAIGAVEAQKVLPGISPLKAIETLPGVVYETADPWGNNEQNESLVIHGFTTQQLGYTMDGVPLGDQQYGNYNGLSVSRAVTSENVGRVELGSGAGALGVASTSNLGGVIETYSSDPSKQLGLDLRQTGGSYSTTRTFVRADTGEFGNGNSAYISYLHHDARAWDFNGHQRGDQVNLKFVHDDSIGKLTFFADWQYKVEPNEDATGFGNQQPTATFFPYTRPFLYPDYARALAYLTNGAPAKTLGNNFSNYFSAAQRADALTYLNYDWHLSDAITWSNQVYYHNDSSRGIVAGPVNQAGLPALFAIYFPGQDLVNTFGGTGYEVRTTEYEIHRVGERSTLNWRLGDHQLEAGLWYEHNDSAQGRRWYPFSGANNDLTPYNIPINPAFTQYDFRFVTKDTQLHLQDAWQVLPYLSLQAGWKASLQTAGDTLPVQQQNPAVITPATVPVNYPVGTIVSNNWFLPQLGAIWDVTSNEHLFFNFQKNLRQYIPYGAGSNFYGSSPWSLGSQAAFDAFRSTAHPETSLTYDLGLRSNHELDGGWLTSVDGQVNYYHVNFSNRLLNVATYSFINPNPAILVNVGGVTTNGADLAATLHFGPHLQFYNGISYNKSTYDSNYSTVATGATTATPVPIADKQVPLTPKWLYKTILSTNFGAFEAQINGDYVGRRPVTYENDLSVGGTFLTGLEASYVFERPLGLGHVDSIKLSANVTNLTGIRGVSTAVVTSNSGGYQAYPIAPRMGFLTVSAKLD
jgi:iron complex outermembrane receptor protein